MRKSSILPTRTVLLAFAGWTALAGAAAAQTKPDSADTVDDVVVTASPYGVSQRASNIATEVLDEQALARSLKGDGDHARFDSRHAARDRVARLVVAFARAMARPRLIITLS